MIAVEFSTEIGAERLIRLPENVVLAPGKARVIVLQEHPAAAGPAGPPAAPSALASPPKEPIGKRLARLVEKLGLDPNDFPTDLAENHDHYAHGAPKGLDKQ